MSDTILTERAGDVVTLRLNNPAALNAMDAPMAEALTARLIEAGAGARAIVLAGSERAFCSGANLAAARAPAADAPAADAPAVDVPAADVPAADEAVDAGARLESSFNPLLRAIKSSPVPILSAVRGAAAGIGASVALACDMIVAGQSAYFLQAFRRVGLVPDGGAALLLAHSVGRVRAMELMLLGERLPAETALAWGLVNRVVPDGEVEPTASALAAALADGPTRALGLIRKAAWAALSSDFERQLDLERALQREAGTSTDFTEGVAAFLEKRPARFTGK